MKQKNKGDLAYLLHMRDAIRDARSHVSGMRLQAFLEDKKTQDAAVRQLEVLGEAAKRVSMDIRLANPRMPWKKTAGMRDRLIHDYGDVDLLVVWETIKNDLPALGKQLKDLLRKRPME